MFDPSSDAGRGRWLALCRDLGASEDPNEIYNSLVGSYSEPGRAYHNFTHIAECLSELDTLHDSADNILHVEMAVWFHDFVYDPRASDNERRSADHAARTMRSLGISLQDSDAVEDLIMATRHDTPPASIDAQIIVDVDLAILGKPPDRFDAYETAIRREYSFVPEAAFREGRANILRQFLNRPRIYHTDTMFNRYEAQARANLTRSLRQLSLIE